MLEKTDFWILRSLSGYTSGVRPSVRSRVYEILGQKPVRPEDFEVHWKKDKPGLKITYLGLDGYTLSAVNEGGWQYTAIVGNEPLALKSVPDDPWGGIKCWLGELIADIAALPLLREYEELAAHVLTSTSRLDQVEADVHFARDEIAKIRAQLAEIRAALEAAGLERERTGEQLQELERSLEFMTKRKWYSVFIRRMIYGGIQSPAMGKVIEAVGTAIKQLNAAPSDSSH